MTGSDDSEAAVKPERAPRTPRQSVFLSAAIERFGGREVSRHRVRDLSAEGMRIDAVDGLHAGATVLVTVGMLQSVGATIVWVKDGWAGLAFLQPIDPGLARGHAALPPKTAAAAPRPGADTPTAGWIRDIRNPYRG